MTLSHDSQNELRRRLKQVDQERTKLESELAALQSRMSSLTDEAQALRQLVQLHDGQGTPDTSSASPRTRPKIHEIAVGLATQSGGEVSAAELYHATRPYGFKSDRGGIYTSLMNFRDFERVGPGRFRYSG